MRRLAIALAILVLSLTVTTASYAGSVSLAWDANTEEDLVGYRIFCRQLGQEYDYESPAWEGIETTCTVTIDDIRDFQFVARAYDEDGNESEDSNEVRKHQSPGPCLMLRILE